MSGSKSGSEVSCSSFERKPELLNRECFSLVASKDSKRQWAVVLIRMSPFPVEGGSDDARGSFVEGSGVCRSERW